MFKRISVTCLFFLLAASVCAQEGKVTLSGVVVDASGAPMAGIVVTASAEGALDVRSLTDRKGRFEMLLRPGPWLVTAARLGGDPLASAGVRVRAGQSGELELVSGTFSEPAAKDVPGSQRPDSGRRSSSSQAAASSDAAQALEINPNRLGEGGVEAAVALSRLTDSVLLRARQKILGSFASNRFSASFWLDKQLDSGSAVSGGVEFGGESAEPLLEARGEWRGDGFRLGVDWGEHYLGATGFGRKSWAGSLLAETTVMPGIPVEVTIGVRYDHFAYLRESGHLSPSAEVKFSPWDGTELRGRLSYDARAPRGELGSVIPGEEGLSAERRLGYEVGLRQSIDGSTALSFRGFYEKVRDHIVNLYRPLVDAYTREVINAGDGIVRGVDFGVEKAFLGGLRATVHYSYSEAEGLDIRSVDLYFEDIQDFERFLERGLRRDLFTTLEATFPSTGTRVEAIYRLYLADVEDDLSFSSGLRQLLSDHSRLDINLTQRIDFGLLSNARISLDLAVNNLLNNLRDSIFLSDETELAIRPRTVIGGIRIEF